MQINNVRFHLRHTGQERFYRPHLTVLEGWLGWGWNFTVGRWVLTARRPRPNARGFFDLGFGRRMLKSQRSRSI